MLKKYKDFSDEKLIELTNSGDSNALDFIMFKYKNMVKVKTRAFFLLGADSEDLIQEGMIGLYKAIREYKIERKVSFAHFAEICVKSQILTAVKTAARQKHMPLNAYVSISAHGRGDDSGIVEIIEKNVVGPEEIYIEKETKTSVENLINTVLSRLERQILKLYLDGYSYAEIAVLIGKDVKSIGNALARARKKLDGKG